MSRLLFFIGFLALTRAYAEPITLGRIKELPAREFRGEARHHRQGRELSAFILEVAGLLEDQSKVCRDSSKA